MRMMMAAMIALAVCCSATAADAADSAKCADRNALNDISVDARLVAIRYYFVGLVRASTDRSRQACYEAHALTDPARDVLNKTLQLIERDCSTMEAAARTAIEATCP
jgi:hypothetical protein